MKKVIIWYILFLMTGCAAYRFLSPPYEYGSLKMFEGKTPKVIIIPFQGFMLKDSLYKNSTDFYPSLEMSLWIYFHIEENCSVVYSVKNKNYYTDTVSAEKKALSNFVNSLMENALKNPDSVKEWKASSNEELIDSDTYFLFPFTIEKVLPDNNYEPNFWTVVGDNKGQIIFARRTSFKPQMWAKDYRYFRDHTKDIIPFGN